MRKILVVVFIFQLTITVNAQITFQKTFGGAGSDYLKSAQQTTDGGFIAVGNTDSFGAGLDDVYLIKTDAYGDTLWTKTYGGISSEEGNAVEQTTDGGYIMAGSTQSFGAGSWDVYLIKTNAYGDTLWTKTYGGTGDDRGISVEQTTGGGYIVTGNTQSFSVYSDVYLIKADSNGTAIWSRTFGGYGDDEAYSVKQTIDGGYIITGATVEFNTGIGGLYLIKTNANGFGTWEYKFVGVGGSCVQQTADSGYFVTGRKGYDVYIMKLDATNTTSWTETLGGANDDFGLSGQQTSDGGYIITGLTTSFGNGSGDVYLIKTDANGDTLWTKTCGSTGYESGNSIRQTTDGGYIIAGTVTDMGPPQGYLIKTDANGSSGCNEASAATIIGTGAFQDSGPSSSNPTPGTIVTTPATMIGSGSIVNTLCFTDGIKSETFFNKPEILLTPNPTTSLLIIQAGENKIESISIYNLLGEKVLAVTGCGLTTVDCGLLPPGIYILQATAGEKVWRGKVVKE